MTDALKKNKVNICLLLIIAGVVSTPLLTDSVLTGTNLLLLLVNIVTAIISYCCFDSMFGSNTIGIMGSMLYTWCPYRCSDLYINANVGESLAWAFMPLVLLGLMQLYSLSQEKQKCSRAWVTLTWGFSLLALSSVTFFCVAVGAAVVMCLVMGRRSLRREIRVCIGKTMLGTLLINAWFLVPMLLRMRDASVVAPLLSPNFRGRGMYLVQYLSLFPTAGAELRLQEKGLAGAQDMSVGGAVVLFLLYVGCLFVRKFSDDFGKKVLWVVLIWMILSSNLFPWDLLQNKNLLFSIVLALFQSPAKWGVAACVGLIWIACRMLQKLSEDGDEKLYQSILVVTAMISFATTQLLTSYILRERGSVRPDVEEWGKLSMQAFTQESIIWRLCGFVSGVALCGVLVMWIAGIVRRRKGVKGE